MCAVFVHPAPVDLRRHNLFLIDRTFGDDFAVRPAHEALPPKFNAISTCRRFVTDAIRHRDVTPIGDRMPALNRLPRRTLRFSKFLFFARMPAYCRWIKNNLCTAQRGQSRSFWIPLVPTNADADLATRSVPRSKSEIARREVKFFVIQRIIGNMHFAIFPEQFSICVDDCRSVVIQASAASLEERCNDHCASFTSDFSKCSG